jgi:hypothetical protein
VLVKAGFSFDVSYLHRSIGPFDVSEPVSVCMYVVGKNISIAGYRWRKLFLMTMNVRDNVGGICNVHGGVKKCIQNFSRTT